MAYAEAKRRLYGKQGVLRRYRTIGAVDAIDDAAAPKVGDALTGDATALPAICTSVEFDESANDGRVVVTALWVGHVAYSESFPL